MKPKGTLFIVPTPIGNLADMTYRAVEVLKKVSLIGAEDTRNSKKLLDQYDIATSMVSYHKFNERKREDELVTKLLTGDDIAIISDAGTPGISDPSSIIIEAAIKRRISVEVLPGATAFLPALIASAMNYERFQFIGFLPEKVSKREELLQELANYKSVLVFYEAPHKLKKLFSSLFRFFGNRKITIAREITKIYETYYYTTLKEVLKNPEIIKVKGEFVIIVEGAQEQKLTDAELLRLLNASISEGNTKKTAVKLVTERTGENKNKVYRLALLLDV